MIIICATDQEEAADLAGLLAESLPSAWGYRIFLAGSEYVSRSPKSADGRDPRRQRVRETLRETGPEGLTLRALAVRLQGAGVPVPRATLYRWLNEDEAAGMVTAPGHGRRAWVRDTAADDKPPPDPRRTRMREILASRLAPLSTSLLRALLGEEGIIVDGTTLNRWLAQDEAAGLVTRARAGQETYWSWFPHDSRPDRDMPAEEAR